MLLEKVNQENSVGVAVAWQKSRECLSTLIKYNVSWQ